MIEKLAGNHAVASIHEATRSAESRVATKRHKAEFFSDSGGLEPRAQGSRRSASEGPRLRKAALLPPLKPANFENIAGMHTLVTVDSSQQDVDGKMKALRSAITRVDGLVPGGLTSLESLPVYFGKEVSTEVKWHPEDPAGSPSLYLGDRSLFTVNPVASGQEKFATLEGGESSSDGAARLSPETVGIWGSGTVKSCKRGVADQCYDGQRKSPLSPARWLLEAKGKYRSSKRDAKAEASIVHELGHLLHEAQSSDQFWASRKVDAPAVDSRLGQQVSSYAIGSNPAEFVAEVFTGLAYGMTYSPEVMAEYARQGGPRTFQSTGD